MSAPRWFPDDMPVPAVGRETLPWWQAAAQHRLLVHSCGACGRTRMPPRPLCPVCRSFDAAWVEVSGRGTIYTYTVVHRAPVASLRDRLPFVVIVVELDGGAGARLTSNLVDAAPAAVRVGLAVEVVWEDMGPAVAMPRFRLRS